MDEFDKIRELSEDLSNRKEPVFTGFNQPKEPSFHEIAAMREALFEKPQQTEPAPVHNLQEPQKEVETFEKRDQILTILRQILMNCNKICNT